MVRAPSQVVHIASADVSDFAAVRRAVEAAEAAAGPIFGLIANAGSSVPGYFLEQVLCSRASPDDIPAPKHGRATSPNPESRLHALGGARRDLLSRGGAACSIPIPHAVAPPSTAIAA